jgi:cysteine synthase A
VSDSLRLVTRIVEVPGLRAHTSLEGLNPGGSIKDHMVAGELADWRSQGLLRPGRILVEASAGSTGRSLAHYARQAGCRCVIFAPATLPQTHLKAFERDLEKQGASLVVAPPDAIFEQLRAFCAKNDALYLDQMRPERRKHYAPLGARIQQELGAIDVLVGAVGTGHSLLGIAEGINPRPRVVSVEPLGAEIPGIRNVEATRFGAEDPVDRRRPRDASGKQFQPRDTRSLAFRSKGA